MRTSELPPVWAFVQRHGVRRVVTIATMLLLSFASIAGIVAQSLGPSGPAGPSPATRHAAVIAQGVVPLQAADYRWTVTTQPAEAGQTATAAVAPGFVVATRSPILVIDGEASRQTRLAAGEALFVDQGQEVAFETFGAPDVYVFISLQSATAEAEGDSVVFDSASFPSNGGNLDADLIRDVVGSGEVSTIQAGSHPTVIYLLAGEATIETPSGSTTLSAGTASLFDEAVSITGTSDGATFVAGYIGTSIGDATPGATPEVATPEPVTPETSPTTAVTPKVEPTGAPETPEVEIDTDEDGIPDINEAAIGTDPDNLDTDGDLLYDGGELIYGTNPLNPDSDGDGVLDGEEVYIYGTDPSLVDTDGDDTDDLTEIQTGTDPLDPANNAGQVEEEADQQPVPPSGTADSDADGISDTREAQLGTSPNDVDTDGDGVNDGRELEVGTDPLDITSYPR